jgi:Flp pilus assembly pilin Flp
MSTRIHDFRIFVIDRGASAVEYGLMVAAISAVIVGVVFGFGHVLDATYQKTTACIAGQGIGDPFPNCPGSPTT